MWSISWHDHWNLYHDRAEFWGDIAAIVYGGPIGGVVGAVTGGVFGYVWSERRRRSADIGSR